jgi:hypothetical protein
LVVIRKNSVMEIHTNINTPASNYLEHFRMAWTNLEKLTREEERKRMYKRKKIIRRHA